MRHLHFPSDVHLVAGRVRLRMREKRASAVAPVAFRVMDAPTRPAVRDRRFLVDGV